MGNVNDLIEYVQAQVRRVHGLDHDEVAACAAVHARTHVAAERDEYDRNRLATEKAEREAAISATLAEVRPYLEADIRRMYEADYRARLDAYAKRLEAALEQLQGEHRHIRAAAENALHGLLEDLKK